MKNNLLSHTWYSAAFKKDQKTRRAEKKPAVQATTTGKPQYGASHEERVKQFDEALNRLPVEMRENSAPTRNRRMVLQAIGFNAEPAVRRGHILFETGPPGPAAGISGGPTEGVKR